MKQRNYEKKILSLLRKEIRPLDVEKVRVACGIGNWQTALKHCLELSIENKIQGTKTTKGWIFWIQSPDGISTKFGNKRQDRGV